jgi:hypothetical protein
MTIQGKTSCGEVRLEETKFKLKFTYLGIHEWPKILAAEICKESQMRRSKPRIPKSPGQLGDSKCPFCRWQWWAESWPTCQPTARAQDAENLVWDAFEENIFLWLIQFINKQCLLPLLKSKQSRSLETGDENDPLNYTPKLKCYYWGCPYCD